MFGLATRVKRWRKLPACAKPTYRVVRCAQALGATDIVVLRGDTYESYFVHLRAHAPRTLVAGDTPPGIGTISSKVVATASVAARRADCATLFLVLSRSLFPMGHSRYGVHFWGLHIL